MRKAISLFAITIIALIIVSVSYAMWSKALYINGTVNTGDINAVWIKVSNLDPPGPPAHYDPNPDGTYKDKDVGSTEVSGNGTQTLTIAVHNGYPSYYNDLEIHWKYIGSIPAYFVSIEVTPQGFKLASDYGANDGPIWVKVTNGYPIQVHNGDEGAHSLEIHVEQCAEQGATYTFTVELLFVQWNEYKP